MALSGFHRLLQLRDSEGIIQFQINALSSLARLRLLNILSVCLRRLNPRRLDFIFDLESDAPSSLLSAPLKGTAPIRLASSCADFVAE